MGASAGGNAPFRPGWKMPVMSTVLSVSPRIGLTPRVAGSPRVALSAPPPTAMPSPSAALAAPAAVLTALPIAALAVLRRFRSLSTTQLAAVVLIVLSAGILAAIVTTTDPLWWHLHFSQLGTFSDVSGSFFNGTLIVAGALVVLFARRVLFDLRRLERLHVRRGTARTAQVCLSIVGVNLSLVGCIPVNVNESLHDNVAASMVLGFAALLLSSPVLMHRMPRCLLATTAVVFVVLFAGAWLFVTETINLALFEVIAFSAMFAWSGVFTRCLAVRLRGVSPAGTAAPAATEPRAHRPRRQRRRVPASLRRARRRMGMRRPAPRVAAPVARPTPRRGYRAWAARQGSAPSTTRARRSPRQRAAVR